MWCNFPCSVQWHLPLTCPKVIKVKLPDCSVHCPLDIHILSHTNNFSCNICIFWFRTSCQLPQFVQSHRMASELPPTSKHSSPKRGAGLQNSGAKWQQMKMFYAFMKHRGGFKDHSHTLLNLNLKILPVELLKYFQGVKEQNHKSSSPASF